MDIPRFQKEQLNPTLANKDIGDAFQHFAYELLRYDYPQLHFFPSGGKDGAIDLTQTTTTSRLVIECKYVGDGGLKEAQRRWRKVANHLEEHILDPGGPTKSQAQYGPWYRTDPAIGEYIFCVSSELGNQQQADELRDEIAAFFISLGTQYKHLAHLATISVKVLDWNDLRARLKKQPHILFRWFPLTRPQGLVPLEESLDKGTFRSYLSNSKLPYYTRAQHLKYTLAPVGVDIPDEEALLSQLGDGEVAGLVVTGSGGVGKTRLMLELGRLAQIKGWMVLRVQSRLRKDALERLAERITPDHRVLLLIDYIETQSDFVEIVETLTELNETYFFRLRYVANCRTSYYHTVEPIYGHRRINISPFEHDLAQDWIESYQQHTVRHILEHSGIEVTESHLTVSRDTPVLAVFVSYLHSTGRRLELAELLEETDFGIWVRKRMQLSFRERANDPIIARHLALLVALFPMPASVVLDPGLDRLLLDNLATDGWIEKLPKDELQDEEIWVTAHDVLADQVLLSYLGSIPFTAEAFVQELLSTARKVGCLRSALITLQRVVTQPQLKSLNWLEILSRQMDEDPAAWRDVRDILTRTPLLSPIQVINILGKHEKVWEGAEEEINFQNSIGWYARWAGDQEKQGLNTVERSVLELWIEKAARHTTRSNFVLTWGIRFSPEIVRGQALNWIITRPLLFQTHYLLVAWLQQGLPSEAIALSVQLWAMKFQAAFHLSFVIRAWLNAKGEKELVREHIAEWLKLHQADAEAQFVYQPWLDAGGEKELVREHIAEWLKSHKTIAEARFVYQPWLDAEGEKELVRDHIAEWLKLHQADAEAEFIYRAWLNAEGEKEFIQQSLLIWLNTHGQLLDADYVLIAWLNEGGAFFIISSFAIEWFNQHYEKEKAVHLAKLLAKQTDIPVDTVRLILKWCSNFSGDEDTLWRLTQLRKHLLREEVAEDVYATTKAILDPLLSGETELMALTSSQITTLLAYLIEAPGFHSGQLRSQVDTLLIRWLQNPASFGNFPKPHSNIQRISYVQRIADLLVSESLSVTSDHEPLKRFMRWVENWQPRWKYKLRQILDSLKQKYPDSELWDIVRFE